LALAGAVLYVYFVGTRAGLERAEASGLAQTREIYFLQTPEGRRYFVLTRGR